MTSVTSPGSGRSLRAISRSADDANQRPLRARIRSRRKVPDDTDAAQQRQVNPVHRPARHDVAEVLGTACCRYWDRPGPYYGTNAEVLTNAGGRR